MVACRNGQMTRVSDAGRAEEGALEFHVPNDEGRRDGQKPLHPSPVGLDQIAGGRRVAQLCQAQRAAAREEEEEEREAHRRARGRELGALWARGARVGVACVQKEVDA